jgi:F-type H+-transporting ATPase subunit epsilon
MNSFTLQLYDNQSSEVIRDVTDFVGDDGSGRFGILAGHTAMMTTLRFGLARFRCGSDAAWQYLAMPGAVLYFRDNVLTLASRHFLVDEDYGRISQRLEEELLAEEEQLRQLRESLQHMEEAMLKRMWELGQSGVKLQ